jgi:hypothetical protein
MDVCSGSTIPAFSRHVTKSMSVVGENVPVLRRLFFVSSVNSLAMIPRELLAVLHDLKPSPANEHL